MKKVSIQDATEAQLREFANGTLGLDVHVNAKLETVRAKVQAAWDGPEIMVTDEPQEGVPQAIKRNDDGRGEHTHALVMISVTEDPGGSEPIPLSVNGRAMWVERGKPQAIRAPYYEVLCHAIKKIYDPMPDGTGLNAIPRLVPQYPFSFLGWCTPAGKAAKIQGKQAA